MVDSYRPGGGGGRPLADRMTFTSGGGDNYRPGGAQQGRNNSEFTFSSNHDGPRFPPTGPANAGPPARRRNNRGGGQYGQRDSRRGDSNGYRGRGGGRGGYRKPQAHERALLTVQDRGSPERTLGVADGSNKFMNVDDMSGDEEEEEEETGKDIEEASGDTENAVRKIARTGKERADGDSVPKWSNPEIYSALPPPEELRPGKKIDFVQLIRKAKNEAAEKADSNNAVAANDDFISFGDDDGSAKGTDLQSVDDDEPKTNKRPNDAGFVQGPMDNLEYQDSAVNNGAHGKRSYQAADLHEQPQQSRAKRKRGETENVRGIVQEWMGTPRCDTAPWLDPRHNYAHLANDPLKWYDFTPVLTLTPY